MLLSQVALCFVANGTTLIVVLLLAHHARTSRTGQLAIALFLCSMGFSLSLLPEPVRLPKTLFQVAIFANALSLGFGWLFGRSLLEDDFRLGAREWCIFAILSLTTLASDAPIFGFSLPNQSQIQWLVLAVFLAVASQLMWIAFTGLRDDLVDSRRVVRGWFIVFVLFSFFILVALQIAGVSAFGQALLYDSSTLAINVSIVLWAAKLNAAKLFSDHESGQVSGQIAPQPSSLASVRSGQRYERLIKLMEEEKAYLEPDLSVRSLADKIELPEHQLRELINRTLGYKNFSAFTNGYRLTDVAKRLESEEQANASILEIAMDSGFQTLSTFNRAFKAHYGVTPSEFRQRALKAAQDHLEAS